MSKAQSKEPIQLAFARKPVPACMGGSGDCKKKDRGECPKGE